MTDHGNRYRDRSCITVLGCLPRVDLVAAQLHAAASLLSGCGTTARVERTAVQRLEIRMTVAIDGVPLEAGIDLAEWCALHLEDGDRLAFDRIDAAYLLPIVERDANERLLSSGGIGLSEWCAHEVRQITEAGLRLRIPAGNQGLGLSLRSWPAAAHMRFLRRAGWNIAFDRLVVPLSLRVGRSFVTRRLLRRAAPGDLLLIRHRDWQACIGGRALGIFSISAQGWTMDTFEGAGAGKGGACGWEATQGATPGIGPEGTRGDAPSPASSASPRRAVSSGAAIDPARLDELPIEAEFLLANQVITLAELRTMQVGAIFRLEPARFAPTTDVARVEPADGQGGVDEEGVTREPATRAGPRAYPVEIRIHGQRVAQAELVALGDQLAVQIVSLDALT